MSRLVLDGVVGHTVTGVEARAKHLLVAFDHGAVLHTHMGMTGAWHLYDTGARWRKPGHDARVILRAGDREAVAFAVPKAELLSARALAVHPILGGLGPDVLGPGVVGSDVGWPVVVGPDVVGTGGAHEELDLDEVARRAARLAPTTPVGDVLLDQRVASGIGNIYRCEALFLTGLHPARPLSSVPAADLQQAVRTASELMRARLGPARQPLLAADARLGRRWVYGRAGQPCRRCGTRIRVARQGRHSRPAWWCPQCQPAPSELPPPPAESDRAPSALPPAP